MSAQRWIIVYLGPDTREITFVVLKFAVVRLICARDAVSKK